MKPNIPAMPDLLKLHPSHRRPMRFISVVLLLLVLAQLCAWLVPVPEEWRGIAGYLPLHTLLETISVVIAVLVFAVGWNSHSRTLPGNIVLLACVFFSVAWLDFAHILSFKGMPDFVTPSDPEKAINFFMIARFMAASALLAIALRAWRPFESPASRHVLIWSMFALAVFFYWLVLYHQDSLPRTFIAGQGLTPFKINVEYLLVALNLLTAVLLWRKMSKAQPFNVALLFGAVCVMMMSEIFFTLYAKVTDIFNLLGHVYKVIAYLLIYRAVVVEAIETPYLKLDEARQSLAQAVKASNTGLWDWDLSSNEVVYSAEWQGQLGYQPGELSNHFSTWESLIHEDDKAGAIERVHNFLVSSEKNYESEFRLRHRDGSYRWILARGEIQYSSSGRPVCLIGSHIDITERKQAEEQLRMFSLAVEQSTESIVITDINSQIVYVNAAFLQATGYSLEEVIGQNPRILHSGKTPRETYTVMWRALTQGHTWKGELFNRKKDGSEYIEYAIITPLRQKDGTISHYIAVKEDVTEKKRLGQELDTHRHHLEEQIQLRTADLNLARQQADAANQAKSVFLSNMSHELRTPLNAVLGFAQLLSYNKELSIESRRQLETINNAGRHLLALINDVLEISRIEAGRITIQYSSFNLQGLLASVEEMNQVRAESKGLGFRAEHATDLPIFVSGDDHRLKQVLINLLGNAVKYTERGNIGFHVSRQQDGIRFDISDTGHGIAVADQALIFNAFYQTEAGIAKGEGTGLGLAISQEYTRLMRGSLSVKSELGQGSIFTLIVPLKEIHTPANQNISGRVIGLEAGQEGIRILVVDDERANRELMKQLMEMTGFEVRAVENGREAVAAFQSWLPRFIWMDMRMPVLDGYLATQQIRSLPGGAQVKIVALTATALTEEKPKIMAAGCNDFVSKPFEHTRLFGVMAEQLGVRFRYAEVEPAPAPAPALAASPASLELSVLLAEQRQALGLAASALDLSAVRVCVNQLRASHPALAAQLDVLVQGFRLDRVEELCREVSGQHKT